MTFFNYMIWWLINQININELQTSIYEYLKIKTLLKVALEVYTLPFKSLGVVRLFNVLKDFFYDHQAVFIWSKYGKTEIL